MDSRLTELYNKLDEMGACEDSLEYLRTQETVEEAFTNCPNAGYLIWLASSKLSLEEYWAALILLEEKYQAALKSIYDRYWNDHRYPLDDKYYAELRLIKEEYQAAVRPIDEKYQAARYLANVKYWAAMKSIDEEYWAAVRPLDEKHLADVKSIFPLQEVLTKLGV